ncbi:unnamed protein product [Ectocarpus sp. CCAP 1310/34]|nr:unnamed protein product [Ectocarpus sp. CCAP 1310/34]
MESHGDGSENAPGGDPGGRPDEVEMLRGKVASLEASLDSKFDGMMAMMSKLLAKGEGSGSTTEGAAAGSGAMEGAAATAEVRRGAPQSWSGQGETYLPEPLRESGPPAGGRHSGEARGLNPREEGTVEIPVHNNGGRTKQELCIDYPSQQVELAFHAWNFLSHALTTDEDKKTIRRAQSPLGALRELQEMYDPITTMQNADDMQKLLVKRIPDDRHPVHTLRDMLTTAERLNTKGIVANETFVLNHFVGALPNEFAMTKHNLRHQKVLTKEDVIREVTIEYNAITEKRKAAKRGARGPEQAYLANGGRGTRSSGRGWGQGRGGGRGSSGGRGNGRGGSSKGGGDGGTKESKSDSSGGTGAGGRGGGKSEIPFRCFTCGLKGHKSFQCETKESDYNPQCEHCLGWGHKKEKCPTEAAVLAEVVSDVDSVENQAYMAEATQPGECGRTVDLGLVGVEEQGQGVMRYVADSGATCSMFRSADGFKNYQECNRRVKGIGGEFLRILGYGDVTVVLQSEGQEVPVPIKRAAHVPGMDLNLISLTSLTEEGHTYAGKPGGLVQTTKAGKEVWFPQLGKLLSLWGYQTEPEVDTACAAIIVPGEAKAATPTDLNEFHNSHGHAHERLLRLTAKQQGVELTGGPLLSCTGCSMAKGQVKAVQRFTDTRAVKKLFRVFIDLGGRMQFHSIGGRWYTLIIRCDATRWTRVFFLKRKSEAADALEQFIADYRSEGTPCEVYVVRSDNEFQGQFSKTCRKWGIKQEKTPPHTPKYNGVAERWLGIISDAALASRIQAKEMFPDAPTDPALWAEAIACACHQLNCTATTANPGDKSPYEMFHGKPPPAGSVYPFLKPAVYKARRERKSHPKGRKGWYLGPAHNHPRDCVRMLTEAGTVVTTRNFTWRHVPAVSPVPPQLPLADIGEGGEGEGSEDTSSRGGGGEEDLASESNLDMTEIRGPGRATLPARENAPAVPGNGIQGDEGSAPPSPHLGVGDFGGGDGIPTSSSSSSDSSSSSNSSSSSSSSSDTDTSGGGGEPEDSGGEAGGAGGSDVDGEDSGGSDDGEYKYDPADTRYPPGTQGKKLVWGASKEGPLRYGLQRGRTRKQTRELAEAERTAEGAAEEAAEEALLSTVLEVEGGKELVAEYLQRSLVEERQMEEMALQAEIEEMMLQSDVPVERPFNIDCSNPELSIPSPIGQKPNDVEALPLTYEDVKWSKYRKQWDEAIKKEMDGHEKTGTFSKIEKLPEGRKAVSTKWVFDYKTDEKGLITDFKARLVARGFSQVHGQDYHHSSSACPAVSSIKLAMAFATEGGLPTRHFDIKQAYTHAKIQEELYVRIADGSGAMAGKVLKVERALYGLKQSGREWGFEAANILVDSGYEQCRADPCVFRKIVDGKVVSIIVIYVDDIMYVGSEEEGEELLTSLRKTLPVKDLGECTWYDGCAIERDLELGTTTLSQKAYIAGLMDRFGITTTASTPADPNADLGPKRDDEPGVDKPVRQAIGCLMWPATFTRPDIATALNAVQRNAHAPTMRDWKALVQILSYLNATMDLGITYVRGSGLDLEVYVDASYADRDTGRRSVTGIAVTVGGTVVSHASKTQRIVSLSTSEAEYIAAGEGVKEALFVRAVLSFIAPETSGAKIKVLEDNQGAISLVQNPFSSARSKHIDVRFHFIRELFKSGRISVEYIPTDEQHADLLTKALGRTKLEDHRNALMNIPG